MPRHRAVNGTGASYLVLVLRADEVVLLQGGEHAALRARLGAGVQLTQLHKVTVLHHVVAGQMGNDQALLQEAGALRDGTADVGFGNTHLRGNGTGISKVDHRRDVFYTTLLNTLTRISACANATAKILLIQELPSVSGDHMWIPSRDWTGQPQ